MPPKRTPPVYAYHHWNYITEACRDCGRRKCDHENDPTVPCVKQVK